METTLKYILIGSLTGLITSASVTYMIRPSPEKCYEIKTIYKSKVYRTDTLCGILPPLSDTISYQNDNQDTVYSRIKEIK